MSAPRVTLLVTPGTMLTRQIIKTKAIMSSYKTLIGHQPTNCSRRNFVQPTFKPIFVECPAYESRAVCEFVWAARVSTTYSGSSSHSKKTERLC